MALSAIGLVLLLLPRFTPRAPRWAESFVPPRYRRSRRTAEAAGGRRPPPRRTAMAGEDAGRDGKHRAPVRAGVSGVNGATAIGPRSRLLDRRKAGSSR